MSDKLKNKKILYIGLDYYDYPKEISDEMNVLGMDVKYYPIIPNNDYIRLLRRFAKNKYAYEVQKYHNNIISENKYINYDYIFFIQIHWLSHEIIRQYKEFFCDACFVLYNWDSLYTHDYTEYIKYFNAVYSFDKADCFKNNVKYLPLFYSKKWAVLRNKKNKYKTPVILFVGSYNNYRRYNLLKIIKKQLKGKDVIFKHYLVITIFKYIKQIVDNGIFMNPKYFTFKNIGISDVVKMYNDIDCVLDIPNNIQTGLTMRIFESLGAHKKIITTNRCILDEKFYNGEIICLIDENNPIIDINFLSKKIKDSDYIDIEKYSLTSWLIKIFDDKYE